MEHPDFQQARKNDSLRQSYLDWALTLCPKSVEAVVYDADYTAIINSHDNLFAKRLLKKKADESDRKLTKRCYFCIIFVPRLFGTGLRQTVYTTPKAFEKLGIEDYFLICLREHEGFHATEMMDGMKVNDSVIINNQNIGRLQEKTIMYGREIRALENQLISIVSKGLRGTIFYHQTKSQLDFYVESLSKIQPITDFEKEVLESLSKIRQTISLKKELADFLM